MNMTRHLNPGQNQNIRVANESFENVAKFKYLEMTLTNQNDEVLDEERDGLRNVGSFTAQPFDPAQSPGKQQISNQNDIHFETKGRLNFRNACDYSVQNLLSSRLISKNLNIKI
jgi:hypothetical protein